PLLFTSTTSSDLTASPPQTCELRTSVATLIIFSAQARASALLPLPGPRHERARVRERPATRETQASIVAAIDLLGSSGFGVDLSMLQNNARSKEKRIIHDTAFALPEPGQDLPGDFAAGQLGKKRGARRPEVAADQVEGADPYG